MLNLPPRAEDALELAWTLWKIRDEVSLDEIDGAFYWFVCHGDNFERLAEMSWQSPVVTDEERNIVQSLRRFLPNVADVLNNHYYPMMRGSIYEWSVTPQAVYLPTYSGLSLSMGGPWLLLGVTNGAWRGEDVESEARGRLRQATHLWPDRFAPLLLPDQHFANVDLRFHEARTLRLTPSSDSFEATDREGLLLESPAIVCTVRYPFPPEGIIASIYDAIAIEQQQWHTRLFGSGVLQEQSVEVAIRTWAIGILIGAGIRMQDAMRETYKQLELAGGLADGQWSVDRKNLVARVPEARPFVYSPRRITKLVHQNAT